MRIATGQQMRDIDATTIEQWGLPGASLMENAGRCAVEVMEAVVPELLEVGGPVAIVCGKGNNGGDGFVVARWLANRGVEVHTIGLCPPGDLKGDAATMAGVWSHMGDIVDASADWERAQRAIDDAVCVVDAILGTGLTSAPRGLALKAIESVNAAHTAGAYVVALDVPSGVNTDDGTVPGKAVAADTTVTFGAGKVGLYTYPGAAFAGDVHAVDIGFPRSLLDAMQDLFVEATDVKAVLRPLGPTAHKGTRGRVLVVAGSDSKPGAAALVAEGALRAGAGLVTVATTTSAAPVVVSAIAEVMAEPCAAVDGELSADVSAHLAQTAQGMDAVVVGPGLGSGAGPRAVLDALLATNVPLVLDADALNLLADDTKPLAARQAPTIVTPHPGEFSRLRAIPTEDVNARRLPLAREAASVWGCEVVLKGARTVCASSSGRVAINPAVNPGMATAGSGDVLAGVITGVLAGGHPAWEAAWIGTWLHGEAGARAAANVGSPGFLASELAAYIPEVADNLLRSLI